jgi:hypothetical protein
MRDSAPSFAIGATVRDMVLPLRHPEGAIPLATHYRTTGTVACLRLLDERGLRARYDAHVAPEHRTTIAEMVPATWMTVEVALAHFGAVDSLGLTSAELLELGTTAGAGVTSSQTGTLLRMTREMGLTPWSIFRHGQRIWDRMCKGGDLSIERRGPKEAIVTLHGVPTTSSTYFRVMMRGVFQAGLTPWCTKGYVSEIAVTPTTLSFREAWV